MEWKWINVCQLKYSTGLCPLLLSISVLFMSSVAWMEPTTWWRTICLTSLPIQVLISSTHNPLDTLRILFGQVSKHFLIQSSWHIKLAVQRSMIISDYKHASLWTQLCRCYSSPNLTDIYSRDLHDWDSAEEKPEIAHTDKHLPY